MGALRLTEKRYDTIVSQPSHPWTAGASHLYTREFLELARDHLEEDGTFVQWLGAHFVDEDLLRSFCATMLAVFPHTQLYLIDDNFLFVGSGKSLEEPFLPEATSEDPWQKSVKFGGEIFVQFQVRKYFLKN